MDESAHEIDDKFMNSLKSSINSNLGEYEILGPLSRGSAGFVFHIKLRRNRKEFALKVIWKGTARKNLDSKTKNQIAVHWQLKHDNILRLQNKFEDFDNYYLVLDYCSEGDLAKHRSAKGSFTCDEIRNYALQIAKGIEYLHDRNIVHRDLKPQNVLVTANKCVKICDFGFSLVTKEKMKDIIGTLPYLAPEIVQKREYDNKIDIWAYGCILYFMATGETPFRYTGLADVQEKIKYPNITFPESMGEGLRDLIKSILVNDPKVRPSIKQVLQHKYFTGREDSLEEIQPMKRVSSSRLIPTLASLPSATIEDNPTVRHNGKMSNVTTTHGNDELNKQNWPGQMNVAKGSQPKQKDSRVNNFIKHQNVVGFDMPQELLDPDLKLKVAAKGSQAHLSPFVTKGLKPTRMDTAHGTISIDSQGFTNQTKQSQVNFNVSPLGRTVRVRRQGKERVFPLNKLPAKYVPMYKYCKEVVSIVKNNTARVKIEDNRGKFSLMWTGRFLAELSCDKRIELNEYSPINVSDTPCRSLAKRYFRVIKELLD